MTRDVRFGGVMKYILFTLLACALFAGCAQTGKVHSRAEIGARHVATLPDGKSGIGSPKGQTFYRDSRIL